MLSFPCRPDPAYSPEAEVAIKDLKQISPEWAQHQQERTRPYHAVELTTAALACMLHPPLALTKDEQTTKLSDVHTALVFLKQWSDAHETRNQLVEYLLWAYVRATPKLKSDAELYSRVSPKERAQAINWIYEFGDEADRRDALQPVYCPLERQIQAIDVKWLSEPVKTHLAQAYLKAVSLHFHVDDNRDPIPTD